MLPMAFKNCPKSNKSPNLVALSLMESKPMSEIEQIDIPVPNAVTLQFG